MAWGHNISPEHPNPKTSKTCREAKPTCAGFTWKSRSSCGNRRPVASQISQLKRQKLLKLKRIQKIQKRKELITSNVGFMWGSPRHNHPSYAAIKSNKLQIVAFLVLKPALLELMGHDQVNLDSGHVPLIGGSASLAAPLMAQLQKPVSSKMV